MRSNDGSDLYDGLKAFKDDRKRPGLRPIEFPKEILVALERRLADFLGDETHAFMIFVGVRRWLDQYSGVIARHDVTLLERRDMLEILWPTMFAAGANFFLSYLQEALPLADPDALLQDKAPFGRYLRLLCVRGAADFSQICEFRAEKAGIDPENCRDTLGTWLKGEATPNLDRCQEVLCALKLADEVPVKIWLLVARMLAKTPAKYRAAISARKDPESSSLSPEEDFFWRKRTLAWELAKRLNIGPDRPYGALRDALYAPSVPRDPASVQDMLERLEKTWEPIAGQTYHIIEWFRGRFLVLCGRPEEAMEHYLAAYNLGAGRDPDIYQNVLDEALALAGRLGKKRLVDRFDGLLGLYWTTEWDRDPSTLGEHFERKFPQSLFFHGM